ncbi:hypothetical protein GPN2_23306 [Streptomyces murinus]
MRHVKIMKTNTRDLLSPRAGAAELGRAITLFNSYGDKRTVGIVRRFRKGEHVSRCA